MEVNSIMRKIALVLLALITVCMAASVMSVAFADGNETSTTTVTTSSTTNIDTGFLIEMGLIFAGIATLGFVIAEIVGMYITRSAQNSITQTTGTAINAIVAMTGVGVTASQAGSVTEVSGVPTQIIPPGTPSTTAAKT
jgi:hypothetical protein